MAKHKKHQYPPWRIGSKPVSLDYVEKKLRNEDELELHYNHGADEIILAHQGAVYLQAHGFKVITREIERRITLIVSKPEKKLERVVQNA